MKFGHVFRYLAYLSSGEAVQWRVLAETRTEADAKIDNYVKECRKSGFFNIPVKVEFFGYSDNLVLF